MPFWPWSRRSLFVGCGSRWEGWFAASSEQISAVWANEELPLHGGHRLMVRGHRDIVHELAEGLDIRLNDPVKKIARVDGKGCAVWLVHATCCITHCSLFSSPYLCHNAAFTLFLAPRHALPSLQRASSPPPPATSPPHTTPHITLPSRDIVDSCDGVLPLLLRLPLHRPHCCTVSGGRLR